MPNQTFGKKSVEHEWKSFVEDFPGYLKYWKKTTWLLKWMPHYDACIIRCFFYQGGNLMEIHDITYRDLKKRTLVNTDRFQTLQLRF